MAVGKAQRDYFSTTNYDFNRNPFYVQSAINTPCYRMGFCGEHKDLFKKAWGKQAFCYTTWYRMWFWKHSFRGRTFYVITGKRGTSYEITIEEGEGREDLALPMFSDLMLDFLEKVVEPVLSTINN